MLRKLLKFFSIVTVVAAKASGRAEILPAGFPSFEICSGINITGSDVVVWSANPPNFRVDLSPTECVVVSSEDCSPLSDDTNFCMVNLNIGPVGETVGDIYQHINGTITWKDALPTKEDKDTEACIQQTGPFAFNVIPAVNSTCLQPSFFYKGREDEEREPEKERIRFSYGS